LKFIPPVILSLAVIFTSQISVGWVYVYSEELSHLVFFCHQVVCHSIWRVALSLSP